MSILRYVGMTVWAIVLAQDNLVSLSHGQQHIAQHLHEFQQAEELTLKGAELRHITCINNSSGTLLQQMMFVSSSILVTKNLLTVSCVTDDLGV